MMNWQKMFQLRGLNYWLIGSAFGWNLLAGLGLLILGFQVLRLEQGGFEIIQILLIIGAFFIAALGGYFAGKIASDGRGPAYGVYGSLGGVAVFLYVLLSSGGILGIMVAVSAVFGGLNGGLITVRNSKRKRQ
jgi:hypothetical protein